MNLKNFFTLILCIVLCESAGIIGAISTSKNLYPWYQSLIKPSFNPPNWIFAPVWNILYLLMAISLYLIIKNRLKIEYKLAPIIFFGIQLLLNILWSYVFFAHKSIFGGVFVIILLWFAILITIAQFYKISKLSGILLFPYLFWITFAAILNYYIWMLNVQF